MGKKFWIITLVLIIGFVGFAWFGGKQNEASSSAPISETALTKHITGKKDAPVSLVEYSDFQCPACEAYFPIVERIIEKYKDRISFEYRHYPLTAIHSNAFAAARASEAAGKQDKFWEMYRLLFVNQSAWAQSNDTKAIFENYAKQLRLDIGRYRTDFASSETNRSINASIQEFNRRGLTKSTPTFLLNGKKIQPKSEKEFTKLIDDQLEATRQ